MLKPRGPRAMKKAKLDNYWVIYVEGKPFRVKPTPRN